MHAAGEQVDASQQAQRAVALVFVVAREGRVRPKLRRQVGRSVADRLDAGLLVIGNDRHAWAGRLVCAQDGDLAIDAEHLGHLRIEGLVAPLEIIADLVRLDVMTGEDLADRALDDAGQTRMASRRGMLANVARQQPRSPKLVRIPQVAGLPASQRHQPCLGLWRNLRRLARPRAVIECRHHPEPHRTAQAALYGVVGHPDPLAHSRRRRVRTIGQQDARTLHPACRFRSRPRHRFQPGQIVGSDQQLNHSTRCCHDLQPPC
jgi:hypothetical protein